MGSKILSADEFELYLIKSKVDSKDSDSDYQDELNSFSTSLSKLGIEFSQTMVALDSAYAEGWALGEYTIKILPYVSGPLGTLIGAWITAKYGRKIRIKMGDKEVEATSVEEVKELFKFLKDYEKPKIDLK